MACAKKNPDWAESCLIENQCVCDAGYARYTGTNDPTWTCLSKLNLDPYFPDWNKCVGNSVGNIRDPWKLGRRGPRDPDFDANDLAGLTYSDILICLRFRIHANIL